MAMPQAIERQVTEAEELQKALYVDQVPPAEDPAAEPTAIVAPVEPPVAPPVVEPQQPAAPAGREEDVAYWKQRFDTVQGKLNAEMPQLFQQLREQGETIRKLTEQLAAREAPPTEQPDQLVTQKDIDAFGEDLIDAMTRVAKREAQQAYAAERAELEKRFGKVENSVGQANRQAEANAINVFWNEVIGLVPDWVDIDKNPAWISWLDTAPEYTDVTYRELAGKAIEDGKPAKIAKLVASWKKESGHSAAPAPAVPEVPARQPASELERQVAPSSVRGNPAPVAGKIYSRPEYEALYDVRNVQRFGNEKAAQMIAEADLAVAENRVRWT